MVGRDSRYPQAVEVDNLASGRIQIGREVYRVYLLVCPKSFLIFPGPAFLEEKIHEPCGAWEYTCARRPEDIETDCPRAGGECPGLKESRQAAGVIDVQVGKE